MKSRYLPSILVACLVSLSHLVFATEVVVLGNSDKPPKIYLEDGQPKGILVDIMKHLDARTSYDFVFELYPWKRAYKYALEGRGVIVGLSKTEKRLAVFRYSEPVFFDELVLVVKKGEEFPFNKISDLQGKTLGIQRGSSYGDAFEQARDRVFVAEEDGDGRQRLLKLLFDRIDVALLGPGELGVAQVIEQDPRLRENREAFTILPQPFVIDPNHIGVSKLLADDKFLPEVNEALEEAWASGVIQAIIDTYTTVPGT